ncbi:13340_t:CDS:2 [Acaulospora morrowiae]|uniref:13340_t:CDS:1 n=1 Tax=Acaulospora morrowiae TaxID=94023 RepID=A0A9N9A9K1_9GLOM|nr:13340_t:CDS:2 [Acaulospora morrowiae]
MSSNDRKSKTPLNFGKHKVPPIPPHNPNYNNNKPSSSAPSATKTSDHKSSTKPPKTEISSSTEEASDDEFNSSSSGNKDSKSGPSDGSKKSSSNHPHPNIPLSSTSSNSDSKSPMFTTKSKKSDVPNNSSTTMLKPPVSGIKSNPSNGGSTYDSSDKNQKKVKRMESAPMIHIPIPGEENYERNTMATQSLINLSTSPKLSTVTENKSGTETPRQYVERLKYTLSKSKLATVLAKKSDAFHQSALKAYMEAFNFEKDPIDIALRKFLMECYLPKETQQIDRVIEAFAKKYHESNPDLFASSDASHTLAFALLMLHTDTFNKNVKRKMTKDQFVNNTRIEGVHPEILEILYDNITFAQFTYAEDDTDVNGQTMIESPPDHRTLFPSSKDKRKYVRNRNNPYWVIQNKLPTEFMPPVKDIVPMENPYSYMGTLPELDVGNLHRAFSSAQTIRITGVQNRHKNDTANGISSNQYQSVSNKSNEVHPLKITKGGRLGKKIDMIDGKKKGNFSRNWRQYGAILSGSQLMFFKDEVWQIAELKNPEKSKKLPILRPDAILMMAESVAVYDKSYVKYANVFRLVCPKGCQYLFQAESEAEMNDWISKINYAATFRTVGLKIRNVVNNSLGTGLGIGGASNKGGNGLLGLGKDDSANKDSHGRANFLRSRIDELQEKISTLTTQLQTDIRLRNNLILMIPYKASTRDRIIQISCAVAQRLRHTCLELSRLVCYHEILEKDLCATVMENSGYWQHRSSMYRVGESSQDHLAPRPIVDPPTRRQLGSSEVYTGGHVLEDLTNDDERSVKEKSNRDKNNSLLPSDSTGRSHLRLDKRPINWGARATTLDLIPASPTPSTPSSLITGSSHTSPQHYNEYEEFSYLANSSELELEVVQTPTISVDTFENSELSSLDESTNFSSKYRYDKNLDEKIFENDKIDFEKMRIGRKRSNEDIRIEKDEIKLGFEDEFLYKRPSETRATETLYVETAKMNKSSEGKYESDDDETVKSVDETLNGNSTPLVVISEVGSSNGDEDDYQNIRVNNESSSTIEEDASDSDSEDEFVDCEEWDPE